MSSAIITVENLGKKYEILHQGEGRGGTTLREAMTSKIKSLFRGAPRGNNGHPAPGSAASSTREEFWALRNVSFEVKQGEVLGIIGRNGAGKSTLLKVLSRITEPTEGRVRIRGRVASLLEVGTGFHPELTGRENIFLNGAILGMSRVEIKKRFDEIVDFAGTEKFLDTPVKRYSSGMYVRLAFAVAAHLEPEILLVDEVLSVGDASFQKKCLSKMKDVAGQGRTVLFISHNMTVLGTICQTALLLESGVASLSGSIREGINQYLRKQSTGLSRVAYQPPPDCDVQFTSVSVCDGDGKCLDFFSLAQPIRIRIEYELPRPLKRVQIVCHLWNIHRVHVLATADIDGNPELLNGREPGRYVAEITVPPSLLGPGIYQVTVACVVANLQLIDDREGPVFEVSALYSHAAQWSSARQDVVVALPMNWNTQYGAPLTAGVPTIK